MSRSARAPAVALLRRRSPSGFDRDVGSDDSYHGSSGRYPSKRVARGLENCSASECQDQRLIALAIHSASLSSSSAILSRWSRQGPWGVRSAA